MCDKSELVASRTTLIRPAKQVMILPIDKEVDRRIRTMPWKKKVSVGGSFAVMGVSGFLALLFFSSPGTVPLVSLVEVALFLYGAYTLLPNKKAIERKTWKALAQECTTDILRTHAFPLSDVYRTELADPRIPGAVQEGWALVFTCEGRKVKLSYYDHQVEAIGQENDSPVTALFVEATYSRVGNVLHISDWGGRCILNYNQGI